MRQFLTENWNATKWAFSIWHDSIGTKKVKVPGGSLVCSLGEYTPIHAGILAYFSSDDISIELRRIKKIWQQSPSVQNQNLLCIWLHGLV